MVIFSDSFSDSADESKKHLMAKNALTAICENDRDFLNEEYGISGDRFFRWMYTPHFEGKISYRHVLDDAVDFHDYVLNNDDNYFFD